MFIALSVFCYYHLFGLGEGIPDKELANVFGTGTSVGCIAVVAVDQAEQTGGRKGKLGALVVAGRRAYTS